MTFLDRLAMIPLWISLTFPVLYWSDHFLAVMRLGEEAGAVILAITLVGLATPFALPIPGPFPVCLLFVVPAFVLTVAACQGLWHLNGHTEVTP